MLRRLVRDPEILEALSTPLEGKPAPYVRAFSWFANEDVPMALQPLLKIYLNLSNSLIRDPRDVIFISHILCGLLTVVPSAFALLSSYALWKFLLHLVLVATQASPFVLMLHCVAHRPLFKKSLAPLDGLVHYVLAPFFGHTWNSFYYHHIKHHHIENNGPRDLSSTITYQRDSLVEFLMYFCRFFFLGWIELPLYFFSTGKIFYGLNFFFCETLSYSLFAAAFAYTSNKLGLFLVFGLPFLLMRFGMMSGNWGQHAFVDPTNPENDFRSSITCVQTVYNAICFNDGYHTSHHLNSIRHWQDHPEHLLQNQQKYRDQKAIIFKNIDFHGIWTCLMLKDYDTMARSFVQLTCEGDPGHKSHEEIVTFLKSRTRRMTPEEIKKAYALVKK